MPNNPLDIEYHQQDTKYFCGAACAQMVLNEIGAGLLLQDDLFNVSIYPHNSTEEQNHRWSSGPTGLDWTMNNRKPGTFANYFALFNELAEENISRKIIWTIHHYGVAPIALVLKTDHWVVVRGYSASADPTTANDTSYAIEGFWISNPWPVTPPGRVPPHLGGDTCGSGGDYGIPKEYIAYDMWQADYMVGAHSDPWQGQYIAVCDPEAAPKTFGKKGSLEKFFDGEKLIDKQTAARLALAAFEALSSHREKLRLNVLKGVHAGEPALNQHLDKLNDYYYIVPILEESETVQALVSIDARFGHLREAAFAQGINMPLIFNLITSEEVKTRLLKLKRIELHGEKGVLTIHPEAMCIYPTLVWKPCKQSLSPYWPFYMVTIGSQKLYMRIDGELFSELEPSRPGN